MGVGGGSLGRLSNEAGTNQWSEPLRPQPAPGMKGFSQHPLMPSSLSVSSV